MMKVLVLLIFPCLCSSAFTQLEIEVLLSMVDYFGTAYLDLLEEGGETDLIGNISLPARSWVFLSVVTVQDLMLDLTTSDRIAHGRVSLVAVKQDTLAWAQLKKVADEKNMRAAKWVLFSSQPFSAASFKDVYVPFDCEFVSVNQGGSFPLITEVYKVSKDGDVLTSHFGFWTPDKGLSYPNTYFYRRRPNFRNHQFSAVIQNSPPYTYLKKESNGSVTFGGYFYEVWKELEFRLKFRTKFRVIEANEGRPINFVATGEYPFCVSPITHDSKTSKIVGLSEPIFEAKVFLFGNRPGSELEWNSYLMPFSQETWLATLGWMFCSSLALSVLYRLAWNYKVSESEAEYYIFTFPIALTTVFRAMCAQGSDVTPRSISCRLLFLSVYMTALVLTSAFSAALFSLLTVPVSKAPFNTFKDVFTASKGYKIGILPDSDILQGIKEIAERFPGSEHSRLLQMIEATSSPPATVVPALERVCMQKNYIFMWDFPNVLEGLQELNRSCQEKIMPGGPMVLKEHIGFGMSRNNPYKELIDQHLVQLKNEGILRRLLLNTWPPHIPNVANTWVRVTVADISPIMYMFSLGVLAGCIILMLERLRWRLKGGKSNMAALVGSLRFPQHTPPLVSTPDAEHWQTRYTDWGRNLHRRQKGKQHEY